MTLTQTAILTKQVISITLFVLILGTISFIAYQMWYSYELAHRPPVEEKPDTKFGVLQSPIFPKSGVSSSNFSYSLDTVTGGLPKIGVDIGFDKLNRVFFVVKPYATFLSADKSQALAEKFNIINPPEVINETTYRFITDTQEYKKSLTIDLDTGNFSYTKEASPSAAEPLDNENSLINDFKNTLSRLGLLNNDLGSGRNKVILSEVAPQIVAAQISLWPSDLDKKPIFTSSVNRSQVSATVLKSASDIENYLSFDFKYFQIDTSTYATYPTKSTETAFNDLRRGKGIVIIEPERPQVSITSVTLGYFLPDDYNPYIQPIYIFEGPSFMAYVPAISSEFLKEN